MTEGSLTVYGGDGEQRYPDRGSGKNIDVQSDWAAKRRLVLEHSPDSIIFRCYVRAHTGRHKEQLYLQFESESTEDLFGRFWDAVNSELIEQRGWTINETSKNRLFHELVSLNGSVDDGLPSEKVATLLEDNQDVRAFTSDPSQAVRLVDELIGCGCDIAIGDNSNALQRCDVGIVVNSQYRSGISLSEDNEAYYRQKQAELKKRRLHESLSSSVHDLRTELDDSALIEALQREISDTGYRLTKAEPDARSEPGQIDEPSPDIDPTGGSSLYQTISYGLNAVAGVVVLVYLLEFVLNTVDHSLAETFGTPIDTLALTLVVFLVGYGFLGIAWSASYLSQEKVGILCLASAFLSAVVVAAVVQVEFLRAVVPPRMAGIHWWLSLAFIPLLLGGIEIVRTRDWITTDVPRDIDSSVLPSMYAFLAGISMFAGVVTGEEGVRRVYSVLIGSSLGIQIGVGIVALTLLGGIGASIYKDTFATQSKGVIAATIALLVGVVISYALFTFVLPLAVGAIPMDILAGLIFGMIALGTTEYINKETAVFEKSSQFEILRVNGQSDVVDSDVVEGTEIKVEGFNKTEAEWVTIELLKDGDHVADDIVEVGTGDAPYRFTGRLHADTNGSHTIQAYTGRDGFSGHSGGKDMIEFTVRGIASNSTSNEERVNEPETETGPMGAIQTSGSQSPDRPTNSGARQGESSSLGSSPSSEQTASDEANDGSTEFQDRETGSEEQQQSDPVQSGSSSDELEGEVDGTSDDQSNNERDTDSEEDSESDGYDWDYTL